MITVENVQAKELKEQTRVASEGNSLSRTPEKKKKSWKPVLITLGVIGGIIAIYSGFSKKKTGDNATIPD